MCFKIQTKTAFLTNLMLLCYTNIITLPRGYRIVSSFCFYARYFRIWAFLADKKVKLQQSLWNSSGSDRIGIWSSSSGSVRGLFQVWVKQLAGPTGRKLYFGMGVILGTILSWSPVFHVIVPGCSPNGSGESPYLTCAFKINSFNLDRTPKIRDFALLNSWVNFLVTLPSISSEPSSETCVMYSSVIPGTDVFCDWPFLGCSCVPLATAAKVRLFLNVAISWG